jgi:predicted transcriptional regulator
MEYHIYHIPTFVWKDGSIGKIGCTYRLTKRMKQQKTTDFEILETHSDIYIASDREIFLQKEYGYKVDKQPYWKTIQMITIESCIKGGQIGGKTNKQSGHIQNIQKIGCVIAGHNQGVKNAQSGHCQKLAIKQRNPISVFTLDGNFIGNYKSQSEAANSLGIRQSAISEVLSGKHSHAKGYTFKKHL